MSPERRRLVIASSVLAIIAASHNMLTSTFGISPWAVIAVFVVGEVAVIAGFVRLNRREGCTSVWRRVLRRDGAPVSSSFVDTSE
jgi:hypothetical protein